MLPAGRLRIDALARASHAEVPAAHGLLEDRIGDTVLTVILPGQTSVAYRDTL